MFAIIQNGAVSRVIQPNVAFVVQGKQYLANFISTSTPEERQAEGIYEIVEGEQKDQRFYWVSGPNYTVDEQTKTVLASYTATAKLLEDREEVDENGDPMWVKVLGEVNGEPAMVDSEERLVTKGLKSQWTAQVKTTAGSLLAATDWMVIRKAERNIDVPAETQTYRAAVVAECDRLETAIAAAASVEALIAVVNTQNWPKA